jgi:hypothetical protein
MHVLNGVCLCWLNGAKWSKPACNPGLITLDQIARTLVALPTDWTWPVWPVKGTGLKGAAQLGVLAGPDRSGAPVWPVLPSQYACAFLCAYLVICITYLYLSLTHIALLWFWDIGGAHTRFLPKFVLLAFEAKFLKVNSKHKLRGSSSYI